MSTELADPLFKEAHARGQSPKSEELLRKYGTPPLNEWSSVNPEKELIFNHCENVITLLADY